MISAHTKATLAAYAVQVSRLLEAARSPFDASAVTAVA